MGQHLPQVFENKARTLTAVLCRAPAMARHIHTIVGHIHAFCTQPRPLFIPGRCAQRQAQAAPCAQHPMPWQAGLRRQLPEGAPYPAGCAAKPGQRCELAIADDFARRYLAKHRIQCRSSTFGRFRHVLRSPRHGAPLGLWMKPDKWSGKCVLNSMPGCRSVLALVGGSWIMPGFFLRIEPYYVYAF